MIDEFNNFEKSRDFHEGFSLEVPSASFKSYEYLVRRGLFRSIRLYLEPLHEVDVRIGDGREFSTWYPVLYFSGAGVDGPSLGQPLKKTLEVGQKFVIEFLNRSYQTARASGVFYAKEIY